MVRSISRRRGMFLSGQYHNTPTIPMKSEPLRTSRWTTMRSSVGLQPQKSFKARKIDRSTPARKVITAESSPRCAQPSMTAAAFQIYDGFRQQFDEVRAVSERVRQK